MKYDLRINNIFWKEVEGIDIEQALDRAGMDADFTMTGANCGRIELGRRDLIGIWKSGGFDDVTGQDEIFDDLVDESIDINVDFGPAE